MKTLNNKIDFAIVFEVKNANPNGDPLDGNRPRITSDSFGEVSDVCLKRKIRNRLQDEKHDIFVQSQDNTVDGKRSLSERFNDFIKSLPQNERKDRDAVYAKVCSRWVDVRSFGQVFAFKGDKASGVDEVSLGVRGAVSIQSAFTTKRVAPDTIQITKSVNSETKEKGDKSSDTMGSKHRIRHATYVSYGSINPQLAQKTGFSEQDAEAIKNALATIFLNDESSARPSGSMNVVKLVWWVHNNKSGQYSSKRVHDSLKINADGSIEILPLQGLTPEQIDG